MVRHAEAEGNTYRRAHGRFDGFISGRGHMQIELLKKRFLGEEITAVYSSDLYRARTTAKAISLPKGLETELSEKLREVNMSCWEDVAWGDLYYHQLEMVRAFTYDPENWIIDGSERYDRVQTRMFDFIQDKAKLHDNESIAFVSHGFAIRSFLCKVSGIASKDSITMPYCDNTAVTLLTYDDGSFHVEYMGDNSHLKIETSTLANQVWWRSEEESAMENMYFLPLDEARDSGILKEFCGEGYTRSNVNKEYTTFITEGPIGMVGLGEASGAGQPCDAEAGWINYMYLKPGYRGRCYGVQMIGQAISDSRKQGKSKLREIIPPGDGLLRYYEKYGFLLIDSRDGMYIVEKDISTPGKGE